MTLTTELRFPSWVDMDRWNDHQCAIFEEVTARFDEGNELVLLDDPCGGGKSLLAYMVRQYLDVDGYYLVGTKSLQDQLERNLELPVIKGRANYVPNGVEDYTGHWQDPDCSDCDYTSQSDMCSYCVVPDTCPYDVAKDCAAGDELPCANYSYALGEWTSPRSRFRDRGLVVCDESDTIPDELMGFVSVDISPRAQQRLGLRPPERKTVESSWPEWFDYAIPHLEDERAVMYGKSLEVKRARARLDKLIQKLQFVSDDLDGWVYEYANDYISFKPVMVDKTAPRYLWAHGQRFLCMTGSGGSPEQFVADTGFEGPWAYVSAPSTFAVERRPIYVAPAARMTKKTEDVERPKMAAALESVIAMYPGKKMLVHTVSYSLTKYLNDYLDDPRVVAYIGSEQKVAAIETFETTDDAVLLAPSLDRGYDNPDIDVCVICKVPSPYLGSKQIQKRLYETVGGSKWYANITIQTLVQQYGRVMRSEDDEGVTIVLDAMFATFYGKWKSWFPAHVREAVDWNSDVAWDIKQALKNGRAS